MRMEMPAAIVENRPAPGIIGGPIPAMVGIDPVSLVPVRTPARIADDDRGLPVPLVVFGKYPMPVRVEFLIKVSDIRAEGRLGRDTWRTERRGHRLGWTRSLADRRRQGGRRDRDIFAAGEHGVEDRRRKALVAQPNGVIGGEVVVEVLVLDEGDNGLLIETGALELEDFVDGCPIRGLRATGSGQQANDEETDISRGFHRFSIPLTS